MQKIFKAIFCDICRRVAFQEQLEGGFQDMKRLRNVALMAFGRGVERLPERPALLSRAYNVRETLPRADAWLEGDILL